jgi:hypothetical protein
MRIAVVPAGQQRMGEIDDSHRAECGPEWIEVKELTA